MPSLAEKLECTATKGTKHEKKKKKNKIKSKVTQSEKKRGMEKLGKSDPQWL